MKGKLKKTNIDHIDLEWAQLQPQVVSKRPKGSLGSIVNPLPRHSHGIDIGSDVDDCSFTSHEKWNESFYDTDWREDIYIK